MPHVIYILYPTSPNTKPISFGTVNYPNYLNGIAEVDFSTKSDAYFKCVNKAIIAENLGHIVSGIDRPSNVPKTLRINPELKPEDVMQYLLDVLSVKSIVESLSV